MTFDFDTPVDRRGTNSLKWDVGEGELPMWVADMDFAAAPAIREALGRRLDHGVFGYSVLPDAWYDAYIGWWKSRHGFTLEKDWLIFTTGVVPAVSSAVRKLTTPAEKVLLLTPTYNIFYNSILNNGRVPVEVPLVLSRAGGEPRYEIDYDVLEEGLADKQVSMMIFCNPHNPVGRLWNAEEIAMVGALCEKHGVTVLSDEIHCDITEPDEGYIPFASVNEVCRRISVTCLAPTKAFNLAGLQTAAVFVPEPFLRHKMWRALNTDEVAEPNAFAADAAVAAFTEGAEWLDAMRSYVSENRKVVARFIEDEIPSLEYIPSKATYLLWISVSRLTDSAEAFTEYLRRTTGLYLLPGSEYGLGGEGFVRMNIACPRAMLEDGLKRLKAGVEKWLNEH